MFTQESLTKFIEQAKRGGKDSDQQHALIPFHGIEEMSDKELYVLYNRIQKSDVTVVDKSHEDHTDFKVAVLNGKVSLWALTAEEKPAFIDLINDQAFTDQLRLCMDKSEKLLRRLDRQAVSRQMVWEETERYDKELVEDTERFAIMYVLLSRKVGNYRDYFKYMATAGEGMEL